MTDVRPAEVHLRIRRLVVDANASVDARTFPRLLEQAVLEQVSGAGRDVHQPHESRPVANRVADVVVDRIGGARE